ncbi:B3 domain-containing protein Os01g0234100 isoform X2 [Lolium perenne]|uniref:B3 domain-containing protein Os01g0234100 isoform X2 n=1 Tax=Lolium perenne TaxID=4522 RepID=UPI0021F605B0|nr:B3 domain-containing protein Os01g0234100-like isoform X2 [Lolium perenne]
MAIDSQLKRKRGRPAGASSPSAKRGRPAGVGSPSAKSKMEQKMALVHQRLALLDSGSDKDADVAPAAASDEKLAVVLDKQPTVINCDDTDDEEEHVPLKVVPPGRVDSEQKKLPGVPQADNNQNTYIAKKKRGRPPGSKSPKGNMEQKLTSVNPRLALIESGSSNNSSKSDMDDDPVLMVSDVNCQKTCTSVQGNCGSAMERAKEVQGKLSAEHPSFVREMLHSHVVKGFWLGLPSNFCNKHLPKEDTTFVLEDEDGHNCDIKYLGTKQALSAGWRGFAIDHRIKVGDVAVFQLVSSTTFKVYILRANNFTTPDGALGLLCLEACKEKNILKEASSNDAKCKEDLKITGVSSKAAHSNSSNLVGETIDGISFSDTYIDFGDVTSFSDFSIIIDSLVIDCKFSDHLRKTYYELCCSQKLFLHKNLLKQINLTLAVGVIMETINIAEGIRACKAHASSHEDFVVWKKTLESFELLGMNVAFLIKRIDDLLSLPAPSRDLAEHEEYIEMKLERARAEEKMKELDSKMSAVKVALKKIDVEMEEMESSVKRRAEMLQQLATAPW